MEDPFVQYMEIAGLSGMAEDSLSCVCLRVYTPDDMDHNFIRNQVPAGSVNLGSGMESKKTSFNNGELCSMRYNPALHRFRRDQPWLYHLFVFIVSTLG